MRYEYSSYPVLMPAQTWVLTKQSDAATGIKTAHTVIAENSDRGAFSVYCTCNTDFLVFEIQYTAKQDNCRKSTQLEANPAKMSGQLTIDSGKQRSFNSADLNNAVLVFTNVAVASSLEQLGGEIARFDPAGLPRAKKIELARHMIGTLTEAYGARVIGVTMPEGYRSPPAFNISPQNESFRAFVRTCDPNRTSDADQTKGSAGFESKFPKSLETAAKGLSLDPKDFAAERDYILKLVRTCSEITPKLAASTKELHGIENRKYRWCTDNVHATGIVSDNWDDDRDWGLDISFFPPWGSWANAGPVQVVVSITAPKPLKRPKLSVISAMISRPE